MIEQDIQPSSSCPIRPGSCTSRPIRMWVCNNRSPLVWSGAELQVTIWVLQSLHVWWVNWGGGETEQAIYAIITGFPGDEDKVTKDTMLYLYLTTSEYCLRMRQLCIYTTEVYNIQEYLCTLCLTGVEVNGYYKRILWLDKIYNSVALVQSEQGVLPLVQSDYVFVITVHF